ncbi:NUDIX domain-containing protein [Nocardioides marmotae]|uniref:NUDIX domain-containing protein n=1 Tax=Nocardioides marmotae TaxID=2663857 RepID=UPI0012B6613F|nr:NUDIX hydrolase [Nocardioides marmotae]MBC9735466.1 NUDIX hydrolase [Nocardioides marmotae]MTB86563.1 NUDIX domain-containing protein [Nocardioides marmotae]
MSTPLEDRPESWPVTESAGLTDTGWVVDLRKDLVLRPGGDGEEPFARLVLEHPGAVIVLAVDDGDRVLCLVQYRHAAGRRFVELPAGLLDGPEDEKPLEVARRELREEAQLDAEEWTPLGTTWSSPGISEEVMHLFLARGLRTVDRGDFVLQHEEADMETLWVPFEELRAAVLDGRVGDGPLVQAVLLAAAKGLVGRGTSEAAT